jgi:hypothetical protein
METEERKQHDKELLTKAMEGLLDVGAPFGEIIPDSGRELTWDNKRIAIWAAENPASMDFKIYTDEKLTCAFALSLRASYYLSQGIQKIMEENASHWVKELDDQGKE